MGSIKIAGKNVITQSGSDEPTISSNVVFPAGMVVDSYYYQYKLASNGIYSVSSGTKTIITRTSGTDASVQNITIEAEHTYIYEFWLYQQLYRNAGSNSGRTFEMQLLEGTTDRNQGDTTLDNVLAYGFNGRDLVAATTTTSTTYGYFSYKGAVYYETGATTSRYVYLAGESGATGDKTLYNQMNSTYPMYLFITKIKGNKETKVT